jgi:hypothetical protein
MPHGAHRYFAAATSLTELLHLWLPCGRLTQVNRKLEAIVRRRIQPAKKKLPGFTDSVVIYHSTDDNCWIAHSLRTDQVGTGVDMGRALADLIQGIDQLLEIASEDVTVAYLREAPADVRAIAAKSKPLPKEIYEVAHKIARGEWPEDIDPAFLAQNDDETFTAELHEKRALKR